MTIAYGLQRRDDTFLQEHSDQTQHYEKRDRRN